MNCCLKSGIQKYAPNSHIDVQIIHGGRYVLVRRSPWRSRRLLPYDELWLEARVDCVTFYSFSFWTSLAVWFTGCTGFPLSCFISNRSPRHFFFMKTPSFRFGSPHPLTPLLLRQVFPVALSINPPRYASCSRAWKLGAASDLKFLLILLSGFPEPMSISRLLNAIGLFADEELVGTCEDKFIAVDFDSATIISSSFCSYTLLAIVLGSLSSWNSERSK